MNNTAFLARLEPRDDARHPAWLRELRSAAFQWVAEHGFPTAKDEAWKYTRLAPILETSFRPAEPGTSRGLSDASIEQLVGNYGGPRLVFVNGYFAAEFSVLEALPPETQVTHFATLLRTDSGALEAPFAHAFRTQPQAFTALNAA
ncbi:MAG: Fe-S cluster assembly protein SufD, partial [Steroidobacteraceae bacterium]